MKEKMENTRENKLQPLLADCTLCPRNCHVNRLAGEIGYCGQGAVIRAARAALHFWEEPCISGESGSGTVFFSGCPLRCVYCQNHDIAIGKAGREISVERLSEIFLELQEKGANNINLVTPTHFVPLIVPALLRAKAQGLKIPVVYNTSSYEKAETLRLLEGLVDIYLPDFKYVSAETAGWFSHAPDYFETAKAAIAEMLRQVGSPVFAAPDGRLLNARQMNEACGYEGETEAEFLMKRGVIVRHLALPGQEEDSRRALRFLLDTWGEDIYISIMNQYTPMGDFGGSVAAPGAGERKRAAFKNLGRRITEEEYDALIDFAVENGIENGFLQEGETAEESFIPAFDGEGL